jgi:hypothetical protein
MTIIGVFAFIIGYYNYGKVFMDKTFKKDNRYDQKRWKVIITNVRGEIPIKRGVETRMVDYSTQHTSTVPIYDNIRGLLGINLELFYEDNPEPEFVAYFDCKQQAIDNANNGEFEVLGFDGEVNRVEGFNNDTAIYYWYDTVPDDDILKLIWHHDNLLESQLPDEYTVEDIKRLAKKHYKIVEDEPEQMFDDEETWRYEDENLYDYDDDYNDNSGCEE